MAEYAVLIDGKNTGRRRSTGNGVTAANLKKIEADVYTEGNTKRVTLFKLT